MCLQVKNQNECEKIQDNVENKDVMMKKFMNRRILMKHAMMDSEKTDEVCKPDILAISTQYTRQAVMKIQKLVNQGQKSTCYKILTRTTQPAHIIAVSVVFFIGFLLWPEQYGDQDVNIINRRANGLTTILYLGSFATHFGAQIWMTFVSGLALYFSLPRHTFGMCQEVLFPKYFTLNTVLSTLTLYSFVRMNKYNTNSAMVQIVALCVCLLLELVVRLYFTPPLLKLMRQKYQMEQKIGTGSDIGQEVQGELINCPHYQKIHKQFRRVHMMTAIANICTMVCTFIHLNYLASKITFL